MTKKYVFTVQSLSEPLRLDSFLSVQEEFNSRSQVQNLIKKKQVFFQNHLTNGKWHDIIFYHKRNDAE